MRDVVRVLLTCYQEKTFFYHMVPLAWALLASGHEVRCATQPGFTDVVTTAGLTAVPVGTSRDFWRITSSVPERLTAARTGIMAPYDAYSDPDKSTFEYLKPGMAEAVWGWHRTLNFPVISDLVAFAREWQPDLVVWDPLAFAGAIAAKACGAAHARMLWCVDIFAGVRERYLELNRAQPSDERVDPFSDWLSGYGRKYGFPFTDDMVTGNFTIDHLPPGLQTQVDSLDYVSMRYVPYGGPASVPGWLAAKPERPRVAFTMGLSATEIFDGYHVPLGEVLASLSELDIEVVATVPESERARLGLVPANVRLVSYVPLHVLAPTCSAAVHHGGHGTLSTFAAYGVPQLTMPFHFDEPILATKLAAQDAGIVLPPEQATSDALRNGVRALLSEVKYRRGAERLRDEITALPSPSDTVDELVRLAAKYRVG